MARRTSMMSTTMSAPQSVVAASGRQFTNSSEYNLFCLLAALKCLPRKIRAYLLLQSEFHPIRIKHFRIISRTHLFDLQTFGREDLILGDCYSLTLTKASSLYLSGCRHWFHHASISMSYPRRPRSPSRSCRWKGTAFLEFAAIPENTPKLVDRPISDRHSSH